MPGPDTYNRLKSTFRDLLAILEKYDFPADDQVVIDRAREAIEAKPGSKPTVKIDKSELLQMHRDGASLREIARHYGCSADTVSRRLAAAIESKPASEAGREGSAG